MKIHSIRDISAIFSRLVGIIYDNSIVVINNEGSKKYRFRYEM